jgi:hypothetical protein
MTTQLGTVQGLDWEKYNTSDFEYDSLSESDFGDSSEYLSDLESVLSDDLRLYDPRCVH